MLFYSKTTNSFFDDSISTLIPEDKVEISNDIWKSLVRGMAEGRPLLSDENGFPTLGEIPSTKAEAIVLALTSEIQNRIDATAKEWGYFNILSAISYISSKNTTFSGEAKSLSLWRDSVWLWAYPELAKVVDNFDVSSFFETMPVPPNKPEAK
jgi:hypothetical protein